MPIISVTLPSDNTSANVADYNVPITTILSTLNGGLDDDNIASLSGTKITANTLPQTALTDDAKNGWNTGMLPAVSSVTANGNRSYDVVFASTVASILSPGMRLRTTRTVAAPTYTGGLMNGSSHYFTKTTPTSTLSTVTNNFTLHATVQPTSYAAGNICGRADAAGNNAFYMKMEADGRVNIVIQNGGVANVRYIASYQSLPLNKKTTVTASWTSGTVVIYFDGVSVPVTAAVTGGTAPTTAGTGGDFSVGRAGAIASTYFPGYISGVGVFDAVLSASTIKAMQGQALTGSETNCIGAWSLNNTAVNQQAPGTNDLTATGGVGYTNKSPYGNDGVSSTLDYALVMNVSTTTATVQVPEGCTIPTTGGITSVSYATSGNPFGWVEDKGRWMLVVPYRITSQQTSPVAGTFYNPSTRKISIAAGKWFPGHSGLVSGTAGGGSAPYHNAGLSTSPSTSGNIDLLHTYGVGVANIYAKSSFYKIATQPVTLTAATDYYEVVSTETALNTSVELLSCDLFAIPAGI